MVIARCGQIQEDGKKMPGVSGLSPLPSGGWDSIPPLDQPASQSSVPAFGCTTALGAQPRGVLFGAAPAAAQGHTAHKSIFNALGGSAGGGAGVALSSSGDARQLVGGGLFRPALTAPVLSFGTLPSTAAVPFRRSEGAERRTIGDSTGAGSSSPLNTTSDAAAGPSTVVSSFASLAAAISDAPPVPHSRFARPGAGVAWSPGAKRTGADSGPGDGTNRVGATVNLGTREKQSVVPAALKAAPETAFDGLDRACTGWVGHDEIETLVGMVGLSYRPEEHGLALLKLCSLRLSRESFLEWYRSATANEQQREHAPGASRVEGLRAGLQQARAVTTSTAVMNATGNSTFGSRPAPASATKSSQVSSMSSASVGFTFGSPPADAPVSVVPATKPTAGGFVFGAPIATSASVAPMSATTAPVVHPPAPAGEVVDKDSKVDDQSSGGGKGDGSDDGDSDDDDEVDDVERQEERAKAEEAFDEVDSTGRGWIEESQFEALMEAVGTTYSVEDHKPKLLSVCREKRLEREVFLTWYDDWLFGEDGSSDGEGEKGKEVDVVSKTEGFASLLASQADGWKCKACLVSNPESAVKCLSCETAKSGKEGTVADSATRSSKSSPGSAFGLSFGSSKETGNFTFGSSPAPASATTSLQVSSVSSASGGFTFGRPPAGAPASAAPATKPTAGGFGFGAPIATSASVAPASETTAPVVHPAAPAEVVDKDSKADDQSSGGGSGHGSDDDGSNDGVDDNEVDDVERQEERAKAGEAFDEVDSTGRGWIEESQFEALMEAVGTTYSVEDHKPKLLSVCREKRLEREVFLTWYDDWLFGEDGSSDGEGEKGKEVGAVSKTEGFASLLASQADGWKCKACLVSNPESAVKCLSCETAKSGKEGTVADSATRSSKSSPGSAFGLSFGSSKETGNFTFGSPPAPASATTSLQVSSLSSASGGFTFGSPPAGAPVSVVPATKPTPGGFVFGAPIATSASVAPASETTAPVVHPPAPAGEVVDKASKADDQSSGGGSGHGSDDGGSNDGVDDNEVDDVERQDERAKAGEAFDEVDSTGRGWIEESQFEALMEAVGTTYSVEDHKPKLLSVCREKRLEREVFLTWYDDWLFGEDGSSDGEGEKGKEVGAVSKTEGFASLLASQADGWKCKACLVSNPESAVKCLSCETAKSGKEGIVADCTTHSSKSSPGSAFGLSFSSSKETGDFTFGSPPAPASFTTLLQVSSVSSASGGFTFGSPHADAPVSVVPATKPTAGGFVFGAPIATSASVAPASETTAPVVHPPAPAGEVVDKDSKADNQSSGGGSGHGSDDGGSNDDEVDDVERQEERAKAGEAFDEVDSTGRGWIEESQFEALMEAVGTTYSVEDHKPKLLSICRENRLEREVFLTWYDDWLFGEDGSSDGEGEQGKEVGAVSKTEGFASLLASQADGWKCKACLVSNPESAVKCLSCETVKSGKEGIVADSATRSSKSSPGSAFGPSFGSSKETGNFTFGSPPAPASFTTSSQVGSVSSASGGFTFGSPPADAPVPVVPATKPKAGGFVFGAPIATSASVAPASETTAPVVHPPAPAGEVVDRDSKVDDQSSGGGSGHGSDDGGSNDDEVDDVERQEERAKAGEAFDEVDSTGRGWIEESQFEALMEAVGTTYSVEDHKPKLLSICREKHLEREVFLTWYDDWLFGEDDSSDGEAEDGKEVDVVSKTEGFASLLASQADGWKCKACLVSNPESAVKCLSCETAKSGKEGTVADSATRSSKSSPGSAFGLSFGLSKETGNFTFGSPPAPASATTSLQVSSVSSASGGFTFGSPPADPPVSVVPATKPTAGGFGFGAPIATSASVAPASETTAPVEHPPAPAGEVVDKASKADDQSCGGSGHGSDDGGSNDGADDNEVDDVERQEERAKAGEAFDEVDSTGRGWIEESQFEALMEAVGTTYSVEDHKPKLLSVCREKRLEREVFLTWYDDWLFGEDGSSDGEGEKGKEVGAVSKTEGFASLLASQADGWKCKACLVSNPESAVKCLSCETAKSGKEGIVADSATRSSKSSPGSAFGLSFGSSKETGNFIFGSPPAPASFTTSLQVSSVSSASGGFTFGSPPADAPVSVVPATKPTAGGFVFGAPIATSASVAPASETTAPVVHPPAPAGEVVDKDSKADDQSSGGGSGHGSDDGGSNDDEVDDVERQEERAKAGEAFDEVDSTGRGWIEESQFEALMEAVGTTYSVEDHKPKLLSICREKHLEREVFLTWYDDWLFGEDGSSDGEAEDGKEVDVVSKTEGFASLLASQADGWKCKACLVSNPESAVKCLSCETVKSGKEGIVADSATRSSKSSPGSAFGLSFGSS